MSNSTNQTERIGVNQCGVIAEKNNWLFREQSITDLGIDAQIESIDEQTGASKKLIGLQIKSGESYFKERKGNSYVFRDISERQYNYWTMNLLPCVLVMYNPVNNMCIWQELSFATINKTKNGKGKGYTVEVPINQVFLDETSNKRLLKITKIIPDYSRTKFDEDFIRDIAFMMYSALKQIIKSANAEDNAVINESISNQCLLDLIYDLERHCQKNDVQHPSTKLIIAFMASWIIRRKPIQLVKETSDMRTLFINENAACMLIVYQSNIAHDAQYEKLKELYASKMDSLIYHLKYNDTTPSTLLTLINTLSIDF